MNIAILMLTYGNPMFPDKIKQIAQKYNLYIHAKYPKEIDNYFSQYLIKETVNTNWGDISLVKASIKLLEESIINNHDYYILISGDAFPLFIDNINDNYINNLKLSCFDNWSSMQYNKYTMYKSSQWWVLNKEDAQTIINTQQKYINIFENIKIKLDGAYDEYYFLTVLKNINTNYKFDNRKIMYVKWLHYSITKHPFYFNKIMEDDYNDISEHKSLFIRKCLPNFNINVIKNNILLDTLYILHIGSDTDQEKIEYNNYDLIIVTSLDISKINKNLLNKCIYIIPIIWKFYQESIYDIIITLKNKLKLWKKGIIFVPEKYTFTNININDILINLPYKKYMYKKDIGNIINKKIFVKMLDNNKNIAYVLLNKYI